LKYAGTRQAPHVIASDPFALLRAGSGSEVEDPAQRVNLLATDSGKMWRMPTYDFSCQNCGKRFDLHISYSEYGTKPVICIYCGSENVKRHLNRIRVAKSEDSRMEDMDDVSDLEGLEDDPQAMGRMMRKMGKEMGEDLPPEFDDVVDRLEAGQSPEEIERAMPDLGADTGGSDEDDF